MPDDTNPMPSGGLVMPPPSPTDVQAMIQSAVAAEIAKLKAETVGEVAAQIEAGIAKLAKGGTTGAILEGIKAWVRRELQWHSEGKTPNERDALHP